MIRYLRSAPPYIIKASVISVFVCALLTLSWWYVGVQYRESLQDRARISVKISLNAYANALSAAMRQRIDLLTGLKAFAEANPSRQDLDQHFEIFAGALYRPGVRNLSISPGGVQAYVFPLRNRNGGKPYELLKDSRPDVQALVKKLTRAREVVLEEPYRVPPDGLQMIARQSVYLEDRWWGVVEIVLDVHALLDEAGEKAVTPYLKLNLLDSKNQPFYSEAQMTGAAPVIRRILVPGGSWSLAAVPDKGWDAAIEPEWFYFKLSGIAIIGLLTSLLFFFLTRHGDLKFLVKQRTAALENELSERKLAEQAREKSEQNYRLLYDSIQDVILVTDTQHRILHCNHAFTELFGGTLDDIKGKPFQILCEKEEEYRRWGESVAEYAADRKLKYTVDYRKKNGEIFPGETHVFHLKSGAGSAGYIVMIRDLSAQHWAQDRISHLNRVLLTIREVNSLIFREKDVGRLISRICELIVKHRGYAGALLVLTDSLKRPIRFAEAGSGEPFQALSELLHQNRPIPCCIKALDKPGAHVLAESPMTCKICPLAGRCETNEVMCVRLQYDDTFFGYLTVVLLDGLSEDPEEQHLLAEMVEDISFALYTIEMEEQTRRSEMARKKAEDQLRQVRKMESIGRLAGGVAHDFNNMLNVILGYSGMALKRLPNPDTPFYKEFKEIEQAAWHSADLTAQLLAFSRQQAIESRRIDLNAVIENQVTLMQSMVGEEIEIRFMPGADLWTVKVDPSQVIQILTNLAANARDAIEKTGTITIETANVMRTLSLGAGIDTFPPSDFVQLTFSDSGVGMDAPTLEQIFEPFFTTKPAGTGTGLGLATVYGIVSQNNGVVHAYSEPGIGTSFKIYFPRHQGGTDTVEVSQDERTAIEGNETVLVVEDEEQMLNLAERILQQYGYTVFKARTPGEAIDFVRAHAGEIDLLLTDVILPDLDGSQLKLRINALKPGIRTVFMSGYPYEVIVSRGILEAGARLIQKPFQGPSLAAIVREALDA